MLHCDPATGACLSSGKDPSGEAGAHAAHGGRIVHYLADPMCSWCWGISPIVGAVTACCEAEGIGFSMTLGGLRAGGGDPWNAAFRDFLRNEWSHIAQVTGQPFGFTLLDAPDFNYDTEPACRAVVTARLLQAQENPPAPASAALAFFSAVQRKFYVEGSNPAAADFYAGICADAGLDFDAFRRLFESPEARQATNLEFVRCRQWGVRSFPTLLFERDGERTPLTVGYATLEQILRRLWQALRA